MTELADDILSAIKWTADYDIDDGFTEAEFVWWIMEGVGADMARQGTPWDEVEAAAKEAYARVPPRFLKRSVEE